jgi:UTP--glucose-1-phosphate uridylyltransferase
MTLRTVVFPVAGLGTRFLPASKVIPKEMLPIIDRPLIQWAADEAVAAGAQRLVFVINRNKRSIADHFDTAYELEHKLESGGKDALLKLAQQTVPEGVETIFVLQTQALGLGHAVLCAASVINDPFFGVILPDDFIHNPNGRGALAQMAEICNREQASVIAVEPVDPTQTDRYGIVSLDQAGEPDLARIRAIVEKPAPADAPSRLGVVGRYVLSRRVLELLTHTPKGAGGEIQLTDAIAMLLQEERVLAYRFEGTRFDCGSKLGLVKATLKLGLEDAQMGEAVRAYAQELVGG